MLAEEAEPLSKIATMAHPGDNCAIAIQNLRQGMRFLWRGASHRLSHSILEGHRFAIERIGEGIELHFKSQTLEVSISQAGPCPSALRKDLCSLGTIVATP